MIAGDHATPAKALMEMVGAAGFEPTTPSPPENRSICKALEFLQVTGPIQVQKGTAQRHFR
jgi:hypothetical protein